MCVSGEICSINWRCFSLSLKNLKWHTSTKTSCLWLDFNSWWIIDTIWLGRVIFTWGKKFWKIQQIFQKIEQNKLLNQTCFDFFQSHQLFELHNLFYFRIVFELKKTKHFLHINMSAIEFIKIYNNHTGTPKFFNFHIFLCSIHYASTRPRAKWLR